MSRCRCGETGGDRCIGAIRRLELQVQSPIRDVAQQARHIKRIRRVRERTEHDLHLGETPSLHSRHRRRRLLGAARVRL